MRPMCISVLATVAILWQSALGAAAKPAAPAPRPAAPAASAPAPRPGGPAASQPAQPVVPSCPFDQMDDAAVAKSLQEFSMGEMLAALAVEDANSPDVAKRAVAADVMLDQAGKVTDQMAADGIINRAVKILNGLLAATKNSKSFVVQANYYKIWMTLVMAEGMGRIQQSIQRMQYLLDSVADRERIIKYADPAIKAMADIEQAIAVVLNDWRPLQEPKVTGAQFQLDELQKERRFRDGWLQFYRAAVTPNTAANKQQRGDMLNIAIDAAKDFLGTGDADDPAKVPYLLLAGMASRELGKRDEALAYFKRMGELAVAAGAPNDQLRAVFEAAHTSIEGGKVQDGLDAIQKFRETAKTVPGVRDVAIRMQGTLLESHLYESQAEALKASNPAESMKMAAKSIQVIMAFIKENPAYTQAFLDIIGPRYEKQDVADLPAQVVVALGLWYGAKPDGAAEAIRMLKNGMDRPAGALDDSTAVLALGELGRVLEGQKRYTEAAGSFRALAERYPADKHAKPAAVEAIRCMDRIISPKDAKPTDPKPTDEDLAEYLADLQVLMKHWGDKRPENHDVQDYHYLLGVQLENVSKAAQALAEYDLVPDSSGLNLLARYRALGLRATMLMDTPPTNAALRTVQAKELIAKAGAFHKAAVEFKAADNEKDKAASVRTMGAEMDLMAAQVSMQILKQNPQARAAAEKVIADWPGMADIADRATVLQVQTYLSEKNLTPAITLMDKIKDNTSVMAQVVKEIRLVIERLDPDTETGRKELDSLMSVFPEFADKVFQAAKEAVAKNPKAPADAMYPYSQVKALAYMYTNDKTKLEEALRIYTNLNKQKKDDAINIRGMARCYRKLKAYPDAMNCFNQLVNGLKRLSPDWWKAQLERAQFCVEAFANKPEEVRKVLTELRRLRDEEPTMGPPGLLAKFNKVEADGRVIAPMAATAPAKPVVAPKPATPAPVKPKGK